MILGSGAPGRQRRFIMKYAHVSLRVCAHTHTGHACVSHHACWVYAGPLHGQSDTTQEDDEQDEKVKHLVGGQTLAEDTEPKHKHTHRCFLI